MSKAVYAGSFDPITVGHLWMVREGAKLFDELVVAIGNNPEKRYSFSTEDRLAFIEDAIAGIDGCTVDVFEDEFLVNYAANAGANHILRGVRNAADFTYEHAMRHVNGDLRAEITTVFLMPPREYAEVSSSLVKGMTGPAGWEDVVRQYVTPRVLDALKQM